MKYYKDKQNNVYAYEDKPQRDNLINITKKEALDLTKPDQELQLEPEFDVKNQIKSGLTGFSKE